MKYQNSVFFGLGCLFLVTFFFLSRGVRNGFLKQTDFTTTVKIQDRLVHEGRIDTDTVMEGATFFVSPEASLVWLFILTIAAVYDRKNKKFRIFGFLIPILFAAMIGAELYGKTVVHHPSPPFFMIRNPTTIFPKYYVNEAYSYPSGHVARAVFLSVVSIGLLFSAHRGKIFRILSFVCFGGFVVLVGVSRIYLGHHWLSDVLGGGLLGVGFSLFSGIFVFQNKDLTYKTSA